MLKSSIKALAILGVLCFSTPVYAQFNSKKVAGSATKTLQAVTLTDQQMAEYVKESVEWMDKNNPVSADDSPYTIRLKKLTENLNDADGIPLNFKVYEVIDVNAFACPDGSVRVFSSLMDIMNDDELLGIIGHEIGHVMKHHSKKAFRTQLLSDAMKDAIASTGSKAAALTESQLGALGSSLIDAKFSQKQEKEADDCGYDFLKANGRNPWGMVMAFEKFLEMEGQNNAKSSYITKMFSSHPETVDRIKRMSERAKADGFERPSTTK